MLELIVKKVNVFSDQCIQKVTGVSTFGECRGISTSASSLILYGKHYMHLRNCNNICYRGFEGRVSGAFNVSVNSLAKGEKLEAAEGRRQNLM